MAVQINGQDVGPIKFTDDRPGKTLHVGLTAPLNPVDGDVWMDSDALNNAGKNLIQTIDLATGGSSKTCNISSDYKDAEIIIRGLNTSVDASLIVRVNGDLTSAYLDALNTVPGALNTSLFTVDAVNSGATNGFLKINIFDTTNTTTYKLAKIEGSYVSSVTNVPRLLTNSSSYLPTGAVTAVNLSLSAGAFVGGTVLVYGVN
jgi:hypothetical protein